ncbi:MAG: TIGR04283 family arsenosugar biosynthesis glycosyltransferase [Deltaproteobacteria bacterium]|nr:TIGR04283 family arsenosugar biosynthesis glycosyltransferase [Deltaproteobacteria bacterium]
MSLAIIVPTLNEEAHLPACLDAASRERPDELVVVDGGSRDATCDVARTHGVRVIETKPGRAAQMNEGAARTTSDLLLFCHADTMLPDGYRAHVERILGDASVSLGAFRFGLERRRAANRVIELGVALRCAVFGMPYGDQALFCRRADFLAVGGFAPPPALEDMALVLDLRRLGHLRMAPVSVRISDRAWKRHGYFALTLRHYGKAVTWLARRGTDRR